MAMTTKQKLAADLHMAYFIDEVLPDPVKLSPGQEATEDYPQLHMEWYIPPKSDSEAGSVTD